MPGRRLAPYRHQPATKLQCSLGLPTNTRSGPSTAAATSPTLSVLLRGIAMRWSRSKSTFNQDLNGDGVIGVTKTVIQVDGSTGLAEVANEYFIYESGGSGLALSYGGAPITAGEFGAWTPIGAVQTSTGYEVAVQFGTADEYTIWTVDSSGNVTDTFGVVAGNSYALESLEIHVQSRLEWRWGHRCYEDGDPGRWIDRLG